MAEESKGFKEPINKEISLEEVCRQHNFDEKAYTALAYFLPVPDNLKKVSISNTEGDPVFKRLEEKKEFIKYILGDKNQDEKIKKGNEYLNNLTERAKGDEKKRYLSLLNLLKKKPNDFLSVIEDYYKPQQSKKSSNTGNSTEGPILALEKICREYKITDRETIESIWFTLPSYLQKEGIIKKSTEENHKEDNSNLSRDYSNKMVYALLSNKKLEDKVTEAKGYLNTLIKNSSEDNKRIYQGFLDLLDKYPEKIEGIVKEYYEKKNKKMTTYEKEPKVSYVGHSNKWSNAVTYAAIVALVASLIGGGVTLSQRNNARKELQEANQKITEQSGLIGDYKKQIISLEDQLNDEKNKPAETKIIPVEYISTQLEPNKTITHAVAIYLNGILGSEYRRLPFAGRIKLINNVSNIIFKANGIDAEKARHLAIGYQFLMPEMKAKHENGEWELSCKYVNKRNNELEQRVLKEEMYKP